MVKEKFKVPNRIKQYGKIDPDIKIYVENSVWMFIRMIKEKMYLGNKYLALVGRYEKAQNFTNLIIEGVINCNCKSYVRLDDYFTKQVRGYIDMQVKKYFDEGTIVGLINVSAFPETDLDKQEALKQIYQKIFREEANVLCIANTKQNIEEFYYLKDASLKKASGYYVFNAPNENMKSYIENTKEELERELNIMLKDGEDMGKSEEEELVVPSKRKREGGGMVVGMTAVLFILCIILGLGLIQNMDKVRMLESKYNDLQTTFLGFRENLDVGDTTGNYLGNTLQSGYIDPTTVEKPNDELQEVSTVISGGDKKYTSHVVEKGENLKQISMKYYGTTEKSEALKNANEIENENLIYVGQELIIPLD